MYSPLQFENKVQKTGRYSSNKYSSQIKSRICRFFEPYLWTVFVNRMQQKLLTGKMFACYHPWHINFVCNSSDVLIIRRRSSKFFLLILGSSFRADRACRKRKFQLLNKIQQQLTSVTRYIDVITTNFSKKMPNYATKHPVAYRTWSRLTNLIFARFSVVRWDRFRKFRAFILHNF